MKELFASKYGSVVLMTFLMYFTQNVGKAAPHGEPGSRKGIQSDVYIYKYRFRSGEYAIWADGTVFLCFMCSNMFVENLFFLLPTSLVNFMRSCRTIYVLNLEPGCTMSRFQQLEIQQNQSCSAGRTEENPPNTTYQSQSCFRKCFQCSPKEILERMKFCVD